MRYLPTTCGSAAVAVLILVTGCASHPARGATGQTDRHDGAPTSVAPSLLVEVEQSTSGFDVVLSIRNDTGNPIEFCPASLRIALSYSEPRNAASLISKRPVEPAMENQESLPASIAPNEELRWGRFRLDLNHPAVVRIAAVNDVVIRVNPENTQNCDSLSISKQQCTFLLVPQYFVEPEEAIQALGPGAAQPGGQFEVQHLEELIRPEVGALAPLYLNRDQLISFLVRQKVTSTDERGTWLVSLRSRPKVALVDSVRTVSPVCANELVKIETETSITFVAGPR